MSRYRRLTREERYQIEALLNSGSSLREISKQLNRNVSSIWREINRGLSQTRYVAFAADARAQRERRRLRPSQRKIRGLLETLIERKIEMKWSPEQIAGRLNLQHGLKRSVSYQTIYRHLRRDREQGGKLWQHLRVLRKERKDKNPRCNPTRLQNRTMISERPQIVERRSRLGDYERDTLMGKFNGAFLLTAVDRTSRLVKLAWIPRKCSWLIHEATVKMLRQEPLHTITNDNGTEFSRHAETAQSLKTDVYFSHAYRSWERGSNENTNGLIRQYFPRRRRIAPISKVDLKAIQDQINNRPRKCLGYKTPAEVHRNLKIEAVALAV